MAVDKAPYDRRGNLLTFAAYGEVHEWRDNVPFEATMTIQGVQSGRSAKHLVVEDEHGRTYVMFVSDLIEALRTPAGAQNGVFGRRHWMVSKRGQNYGIKIATDRDYR